MGEISPNTLDLNSSAHISGSDVNFKTASDGTEFDIDSKSCDSHISELTKNVTQGLCNFYVKSQFFTTNILAFLFINNNFVRCCCKYIRELV